MRTPDQGRRPVWPYWTIENPEERSRERVHFYKNVSMMGSLLLAVADTHGKPSPAYRTRRGTRHATAATSRRVHEAGDTLHSAADKLSDGVKDVTSTARDHLPIG